MVRVDGNDVSALMASGKFSNLPIIDVCQLHQSKVIRKIENVRATNELYFENCTILSAQNAYYAFSTIPEIISFVAIHSRITTERYQRERNEVLFIQKKLYPDIYLRRAESGQKFLYIP